MQAIAWYVNWLVSTAEMALATLSAVAPATTVPLVAVVALVESARSMRTCASQYFERGPLL